MGKIINIDRDELRQIWKEEDQRAKSLSSARIRHKLYAIGFKGIRWTQNYQVSGMGGFFGHGMVVATCDFKEKDSLAVSAGNIRACCAAIGRTVAVRQMNRQATRMAILCYREDGPKAVIELFEEAGYEFMTPDELIASLGPCKPPEADQA